MSTINILGIDIGKFTFHLVGHDSAGREVYRKKFSRPKLIQVLSTLEITTIAMEACSRPGEPPKARGLPVTILGAFF